MTDVPLLKYVERLNDNLEKRLEEKAVEQDRALKLALEVQNGKFHSFDEFRTSVRIELKDQKERMDKYEGAGWGIKNMWGFVAIAISLIFSALVYFR